MVIKAELLVTQLNLRFEVFLIRFARYILKNRNVERSKHVSRKDNNAMWYMAEQLESIETRMLTGYDGEQ